MFASIAFFFGIILGISISFLFKWIKTKSSKEFAQELFHEIGNSFDSLSLSALSKVSEALITTAKEKLSSERELHVKELDGKKTLIDQQLRQMTVELGGVSKMMQELENDRAQKFGELTTQLKNMGEQTATLSETTRNLKEALSNSRVRGQWGQRMAEDVLRLAGFLENVNYTKEKEIEGLRSRPDFTFLLPRDLKLNMDVKFPWENYMRFLECESELEKSKYKHDFLKDVKAKIKEVTGREYINAEQHTLDYVLLFIPNEQLYSFIHENDRAILDEGLQNKVVFCSPITLFAILAVIRQAIDNFSLEKTSHEILAQLGSFKKQWGEFLKKLKTVGDRIDDARKEFDSLTTTRKRMLERPLEKIESLREQRGISSASLDSEENLLLSEEG